MESLIRTFVNDYVMVEANYNTRSKILKYTVYPTIEVDDNKLALTGGVIHKEYDYVNFMDAMSILQYTMDTCEVFVDPSSKIISIRWGGVSDAIVIQALAKDRFKVITSYKETKSVYDIPILLEEINRYCHKGWFFYGKKDNKPDKILVRRL